MTKSPQRDAESEAPEPEHRPSGRVESTPVGETEADAPSDAATDAAESSGRDDRLTAEDLAVIGLRPKEEPGRGRRTAWLALLLLGIMGLLFVGYRTWSARAPEPAPAAVEPTPPRPHEPVPSAPPAPQAVESAEPAKAAPAPATETANAPVRKRPSKSKPRRATAPITPSVDPEPPRGALHGPSVARYPDLAPQVLDELIRKSETEEK